MSPEGAYGWFVNCAVCNRPVDYTGGDTLSGYTVKANVCTSCNRKLLAAEGLVDEAARDIRNERIAKWFWRGLLIGLPAALGVLALIGLASS